VVLQVVILRDGLLVGTEVFVPGAYSVGSDPGADLRLDDASIQPSHAVIYFQNGKAAIQDKGGGVSVNGSHIRACEIRSVDELMVGPFVLKVRIVAQKAASPLPPPEVAALLGDTSPKSSWPEMPVVAHPPAKMNAQQPPLMPTPAPQARPHGTVHSARKMAAERANIGSEDVTLRRPPPPSPAAEAASGTGAGQPYLRRHAAVPDRVARSGDEDVPHVL